MILPGGEYRPQPHRQAQDAEEVEHIEGRQIGGEILEDRQHAAQRGGDGGDIEPAPRMAATRRIGDDPAERGAEPPADRGDRADGEAVRRLHPQIAVAVEVDERAQSVAAEAEETAGDGERDEAGGADHQFGGVGIAQPDRLDPGADRIGADRDRRPLDHVGGDHEAADHEHRCALGGGQQPVRDDDEADRGDDDDRQQQQIAPDRGAAGPQAAERQDAERRKQRAEFARGGAEGVRIAGVRVAIDRAAHGFADRGDDEQRQQQPGQPDGHIGRLPADEAERGAADGIKPVPQRHDMPADHQRRARAEIDAAGIDGERGGTLRLRKIILQDREGGRAGARLADADADPRERKLAEIGGGAGKGSHRRPETEPDRQRADPVPAIRQPGERQPEQRVEQREGRAEQQPHLRIGQAEIGLQIRREDRDDLAIDEVECIDDREQSQHIPAIAADRLCLGFHHPALLSTILTAAVAPGCARD